MRQKGGFQAPLSHWNGEIFRKTKGLEPPRRRAVSGGGRLAEVHAPAIHLTALEAAGTNKHVVNRTDRSELSRIFAPIQKIRQAVGNDDPAIVVSKAGDAARDATPPSTGDATR